MTSSARGWNALRRAAAMAMAAALIVGGATKYEAGIWGSVRAGSVLEDDTAGKERSGAAAKVAPDPMRALARLEPATGLVTVGARPGQRVLEIRVKEGDNLGAGDVIASLEGRRAAEQQLAIVEATKTAADWKRALRKRGLEVERALSDQTRKLQLNSAKRSAELTKKKFDTSAAMFKTFGSSLKGKELYDAEGALFQLELGQIKTELDWHMLEAGIGAETKKRAIEDEELSDKSPGNQVLEKQVELARAGLAETEVLTPRSGTVLRVLLHEGEVSQGAVLEMGDLSAMVAVAEVYEADAGGIKVGDGADVLLFGVKVAGKVSKVSRIVGRNQMTSIDPRALRDLRVVLVTIALSDATVASRLVSMEVESTIRPSGFARGRLQRTTE